MTAIFDLEEADRLAKRLKPWLRPTPVVNVSALAQSASPSALFAKFELWQQTGSFKARGALANILALDTQARARGVTAVSAGNHAIATAFAAKTLGTSAKVVMLASASPVRVARCESYGAEVVKAADVHQAFDIAESIASEERRAFIHPFEGETTALATAGVGAELVRSMAPVPDAVIVPVGGGGLAAGVAAAVKSLSPDCMVFGVEPNGADSMSRSFDAGSPQKLSSVDTIADSLGAPMALPISFGLCHRFIDEMVRVSDDDLRRAMRRMHDVLGLAVEPACASGFAALETCLAKRLSGKRVGLVFCGSNIDAATWFGLLQ